MVESSQLTTEDGLRADARRNRERILVAARAVFAEHGIDAPMATVARKAGVGVATLYRRFPTRDDLVRAAFAQQLRTCAQELTAALVDPDPWRGFQRLVETTCEQQRAEKGFPAAFTADFPMSMTDHQRPLEQAERDLATVVRRAQAAGALRADFQPSDIAVILLAHAGLVAALPEDGAASRRLVAYLLQSFRTGSSNRPLPPPSAFAPRDLPVGTQPKARRR
ncbi:TetR family transcriptional regulator [Tamaricihabitans halophyticus]|uniref:TetR family transcriptional regulator n=1 Tax=Tamaricihabitans halophyticus TaxID=1262583 RepID=A0A4R2R0M3_9PSEU|nr:TetR/AcrR family transcriptional regulator [Tamaricihabitans halophyticus]TCP55109.1 TetR family transcriptional regulator [Tamaricihabitans halophyticus]